MNASVYVLEGAWNKPLEAPQVLPYLDAYSRSHGEVRVHHRTIRNAEDIKYYVSKIPKNSRAFLYVACHGAVGLLDPSDGRSKVPLAAVVDALSSAKLNAIGFLHFGCCEFVESKQRKKVLTELRDAAKAVWVSGYTKEVDWLSSTLLDLALMSEVFVAWHKSPNMKDRAQKAATRFVRSYKQLARSLGFSGLSAITKGLTLFPARVTKQRRRASR